MPSNHLILCHPLLLLSSIFPSVRVFSRESALRIRWPEHWSFRVSISLSSAHSGLISFRMDWLDLLAVRGARPCVGCVSCVIYDLDTNPAMMVRNPIPALATLPCASPFVAKHITRSESEICRLSLGFPGVHPSHSCTKPLAETSRSWGMSMLTDIVPPGSEHQVVLFLPWQRPCSCLFPLKKSSPTVFLSSFLLPLSDLTSSNYWLNHM